MLDILNEVKLALAAQGIPAEAVEGVIEACEDFRYALVTTAERNVASTILAKLQSAKLLSDMAQVEAAREAAEGEEVEAGTGAELASMSAQLLSEVHDLMDDSEDTEGEGPGLTVVPPQGPMPVA